MKTKASCETKRSQSSKSDNLCVLVGTKNEERQFSNIVIKDKGRGQNMNSIQEEKETAESQLHGNA